MSPLKQVQSIDQDDRDLHETAHPVALLKALFASADRVTTARMEALYAENICFRDPAGEIVGRDKLVEHTLALYRNLISCDFEYLDDIVGHDRATVRWVMHFRHPRLRKGRRISVRGSTYIQWSEKVNYHEDYFDLGSMFYENVPLLGKLTKTLKQRLSAG